MIADAYFAYIKAVGEDEYLTIVFANHSVSAYFNLNGRKVVT